MDEQKTHKGIAVTFNPDQEYVTPENVAELFKSVLKVVGELKDQLETRISSTDTQAFEDLQSLLDALDTKEAELKRLVEEAKGSSKTDLSTLAATLRAEIAKVEALIPTLPEPNDLTPFEQRLANVEDEVGLIRQAEDIRNRLELLEGDERLKTSAIDGLDELMASLREEFKKVVYVGSGGGLNPAHAPRNETFTMNGSDTSVVLSQGVAADGNAIILRYQGQTLDLGSHYSVDGNKVTLTFTPDASSIISATYWP